MIISKFLPQNIFMNGSYDIGRKLDSHATHFQKQSITFSSCMFLLTQFDTLFNEENILYKLRNSFLLLDFSDLSSPFLTELLLICGT